MFYAFLVYFSRFGMLQQEKSGNLASHVAFYFFSEFQFRTSFFALRVTRPI
jgi:hypothetical protein